MADAWFVQLAGTEQGPISPAQLRELVRKKIVKPDTPVRKGENRWVRAGKVHGLFESAQKPSPTPSSTDIPATVAEDQAEPAKINPKKSKRPWFRKSRSTPSRPITEASAPGNPGVAVGGSSDQETRVWTGLTDETESWSLESEPALDLGLKIDEPTSLRDGPRPPLPVPDPSRSSPEIPEASPSPSSVSTEAPVLEPEAHPEETGEAPMIPLGIRVEEPATLRDEPRVPVPPAVEPSLSGARKTDEPEGTESRDRTTRKVYLGREASATSMGLVIYFQAVLLLLFTGFWTARMLDSLKDLEPGPDLRTLQVSILHEGTALLACTGALFLMGAGLRFLTDWGRWISATLMFQTVLGSMVTLLTLALRGESHLAPIAYVILVAGVSVPLWTLYVLLSEPADVVFSSAYRELVTRTRRMRRPISWIAMMLFLMELVALGYLGWSLHQG